LDGDEGRSKQGDPDPQWFAYHDRTTVTFAWPELICFGLELDAMLELLNNAVQELKSRPVTPSSGLRIERSIGDFSWLASGVFSELLRRISRLVTLFAVFAV
jgi:hypothetical protein